MYGSYGLGLLQICYIAFFTLIVKPGHALSIEMGYGLEIAMIHMIWFSFLAYMMTHRAVKSNLSRIQYYIVKAMGALLVAFGGRIAMLNQAIMLPTAVLD